MMQSTTSVDCEQLSSLILDIAYCILDTLKRYKYFIEDNKLSNTSATNVPDNSLSSFSLNNTVHVNSLHT